MTPSAILLIICLSLFLFLSLTFSIYVIRHLLKNREEIVELPTTRVTQFTPSGNEVQEKIGTAMPHYQLAKAE